MGKKRTNVYVVCCVLFPLAFAGFCIGFGCPVWLSIDSGKNVGLWQYCAKDIINDCTTLDFDQFMPGFPGKQDYMIGVRAVEIFALAMLCVAAVDLVYENCYSVFRGRQLSERLAPGLLCILGGFGGLAGIIAYAIKTNEVATNSDNYGWALGLVAAGSGLAVILGVGFCVSGLFLENTQSKESKHQQNGDAMPYATTNDENYELSAYTNRGYEDNGRVPSQPKDNLPGYAHYNGLMINRPGEGTSLPRGSSPVGALPAYNNRYAGGDPPPVMPKSSQYYSLSDDRVLEPGFDLSEGYLPGRPKASMAQEDPYSRGGGRLADDPYSRSGARDDPYSHGAREDPYHRGVREDPYSRGAREDPHSRGAREDPYSRGAKEDPYSRGAKEDHYSRGAREDPFSRGGAREDPYSRGGRDDPYARGDARDVPRAGYNDPYGFDRDPLGRSIGEPGGRDTRDSFYRPGKF